MLTAEAYSALAKLSGEDASQAIFEAGQVNASGQRDGVIPTFTLLSEDDSSKQ